MAFAGFRPRAIRATIAGKNKEKLIGGNPMINRRTFAALLAGTVAAPKRAWSEPVTAKTVFYTSVGPELTLFDIDVADAALQKRSCGDATSQHPICLAASVETISLCRVEQRRPRCRGRQASRERIPHRSRIGRFAARTASRRRCRRDPSTPVSTNQASYLLTAYNDPSNATVHRIKSDGTLGEAVSQQGKPDAGIYGHQIRTTPGNQTAILVSRGNNAAGGKPEDPGALKLYAFKDGALTNLASVAPGNGLGFGPRHLDFHPTQPWVYVSIERQNKLYVYQLQPDGGLGREPIFIKDTLADPGNEKPAQGAGPIHVHPNGRFVYVTNRNQGEVDVEGKKVFNGGENNVAVFAIDERDRRAEIDPDHRWSRHPPANFRHRPERAPAGGNQHQTDAAARRQDTDHRHHGLSHRR